MDSEVYTQFRNKKTGDYNLVLHIGVWRKYIPEQQIKLIIAEALSYCVSFEDLIIKGYLISSKKVYLVLKCEEKKIAPVFFTFYHEVRKGIRIEWQKLKLPHHFNEDKKEITLEDLFKNIFSVHHFMNYELHKLITGHDIEFIYYDPQLARLKEFIHNYNFCSAIDYSGAEGPVKMNKEEDEEENRTKKKSYYKK
jgi:hypothetical protein